MSRWTFDPVTQQLHTSAGVQKLSEMEAAAFAYLYAREGQVVRRESLETDVWGLAPGVRSETVPVTLRNIRRKLPDEGGQLTTVRGVGWKLTLPRLLPTTLPRLGSPFFPRPAELERLSTWYSGSWRALTLVGPAGVGKSRIAVEWARTLDVPVIYVDASGGGLQRAVLTATGMVAGGYPGLQQALGPTQVLFVVDACEARPDEVHALIDALPDARFVLTSQVPLDRPDEAVHTVKALEGDAGRDFARRRLAASRWGHDPEPAVLDALLAALDGLPLGIEVVAGNPTTPADVLAQIREGGLGTLRSSALGTALASSVESLDGASHDVLRALCVLEAPVADTTVSGWLGADGSAAVALLANHSMVQREGSGWRVLSTLRGFVREETYDWDSLNAERDAWLIQRADHLEEQIFQDPAGSRSSALAVTNDLLGLLQRAKESDVGGLMWVLVMISQIYGPLALQREVVEAAARRAPTLPLVQLFGAALGQAGVQVEAVFARASAADQARLLALMAAGWLPQAMPGGFEAAEPTTLLNQLHRSRAQLDGDNLEDRVQEQLSAERDYPMARAFTRVQHARILQQRGSLQASVHAWQQLLTDLAPLKLAGPTLLVWMGLVDALLEIEPERAAEEALELARFAIEFGYGDSWAVGRIGVLLLVLGRFDVAGPFLEHGVRSPHGSTATAAGLLHRALRAYNGESGLGRPRSYGRIPGVLNDGTALEDLVKVVVETSFDHADGHTERGMRAEQRDAEAPDTRLFRVWASHRPRD